MRHIAATDRDRQLLRNLTASGFGSRQEGPTPDFSGVIIMKPWGFECEIFSNGACSLWFLSIEPGHAVSMHCHRNKTATFIPLSNNAVFRTLDFAIPLVEGVTIERGVFHSQENNSDEPALILEYESPPDKLDLVRYTDRYGREGTGYETAMVRPMDEVNVLRMLRGNA